jgi:uncharacterized membrane protein YqhA
MKQVLGLTRFLVLLGVIGSLLASAILFLIGILQVVNVAANAIRAITDATALKVVAIEAIQLADDFLVATALFIVSVGLCELFIG